VELHIASYYDVVLLGCLMLHDVAFLEAVFKNRGATKLQNLQTMLEEFIVMQSEAGSLTEESLESLMAIVKHLKPWTKKQHTSA